MENSVVVKMLEGWTNATHAPQASSEEVEHGKLALGPIPTSAAAFRAIPAQLQRPPLFLASSPLHTLFLAEACISRHARSQLSPSLIKPKSIEHYLLKNGTHISWKRDI